MRLAFATYLALAFGATSAFGLACGAPEPLPFEAAGTALRTAEPSAMQEPAITVLHAAPDGTGDECTEALPCSVLTAKKRVTELPCGAEADVTVELADGVYRLKEALRFTASDSGKNGHKVVWRARSGAHPVLSGAIRVSDWTLHDATKNIWKAAVPKDTRTRQLYVNAMRMPVAQGAPPVALRGDITGYTAADASYATWRNPDQLEFVYVGGSGPWTEPRCRVGTVEGTRLTMSQPCWNNATSRPTSLLREPPTVAGGRARLVDPAVELPSLNPADTPERIENAYELMQVGQWYLDVREATLFMRATAGFDFSTADVELPVLEQLVVGEGTLDEPVHDLEFRGIEFAYATWNGPSTSVGFPEIQANLIVTGAIDAPPQGTCNFSMPAGTCPYGAYTRVPGNIQWHAAKRVSLVGNHFQHLGAAGVVFEYGSQGNRVEGNLLRDISGNGVVLGNSDDPHPSDVGADAREINTDNLIANNLITDIGAEYHGAVGIMLFVTQQTVVRNNEIHHVPYTGISSGAVAGHADIPSSPDTTTNVNARNQISHNLIYRYLATLSDGGAIYLEGHQHETLRGPAGEVDSAQSYANGLSAIGNVVYGQGGVGNALYDDIGSQWITWRDNVQWQASSGQGGCLPVGHITFVSNYHSDVLADFGCGQPVDVLFQDNHQIPRRPRVDDLPLDILGRAGIEASFRDLSVALGPHLEYANPSSGQATEGTRVLVAGSGFDPATEVAWGQLRASSVQVLSSNFLVALAPRDADLSALRVKTSSGTARMRINDDDPGIVYVGNWIAGTFWGNHDNETQHSAEANGAAFEYTFVGTGVDFITAFDSNRGLADVYVDDVLMETVSCAATTYASQQICARVDGLPRGIHTLRVVKKSGQFLTLDALQLRGADES